MGDVTKSKKRALSIKRVTIIERIPWGAHKTVFGKGPLLNPSFSFSAKNTYGVKWQHDGEWYGLWAEYGSNRDAAIIEVARGIQAWVDEEWDAKIPEHSEIPPYARVN